MCQTETTSKYFYTIDFLKKNSGGSGISQTPKVRRQPIIWLICSRKLQKINEIRPREGTSPCRPHIGSSNDYVLYSDIV